MASSGPNAGWDWLYASGICKPEECLQRVVMDFSLDDCVKIYKQAVGQEEWFKVALPSEVKVEVVTHE